MEDALAQILPRPLVALALQAIAGGRFQAAAQALAKRFMVATSIAMLSTLTPSNFNSFSRTADALMHPLLKIAATCSRAPFCVLGVSTALTDHSAGCQSPSRSEARRLRSRNRSPFLSQDSLGRSGTA